MAKTINRSIEIIDRVVNEISIPYSTMSNNKVMLSFAKIFSHKEDDLIAHYLDKFLANYDKDFGRYYLSCDIDMVREIFNHYNIPIEADKISDERELVLAQLSGKDKFDIFPFEYEIVRQFYLYANNHSLDKLDARFNFSGVDELLLKEKISLYGNGINWSKAWNCFSQLEKQEFVRLLMED